MGPGEAYRRPFESRWELLRAAECSTICYTFLGTWATVGYATERGTAKTPRVSSRSVGYGSLTLNLGSSPERGPGSNPGSRTLCDVRT